jgi:hypothetical protein
MATLGTRHIFNSLLFAATVTSCTHQMYPGKPVAVTKLPGGNSVPAWVGSTDSNDRPTDGYFRIAAIADDGVTSRHGACIGSSNFLNSEKANYAVVATPVGFMYWTTHISYPLYSKVTTSSEENVCRGYRDYVIILPWHPIEFNNNLERINFKYTGQSVQNTHLTEYMASASAIAGLFSGGGAVAAFAAKETTKAAMSAIDNSYSRVTSSINEVSEPITINYDKIRSGKYNYKLPMLYFDSGESDKLIEQERKKSDSPYTLFNIDFLIDYTRSMVGVATDGNNQLPHAYLSQASYYLTYTPPTPSDNPAPKQSFLQTISTSYPGIIEKLAGPDKNQACREVRSLLRTSGYSPSDQGALYGALLYLANGSDSNFLLKSDIRFSDDCFPLNELGGNVLAVYPELALPPIRSDEFTQLQFGEPAKGRYLAFLKEVALGMSYNNNDKSGDLIGKHLADNNISFTSSGTLSGHNGTKAKDEAVTTLTSLNVSRIGCFMPAEHFQNDGHGPRLVLVSSDDTAGVMVTFRLDQSGKASAVEIADLNSDVSSYIKKSTNFDRESQCVKIAAQLTLPQG